MKICLQAGHRNIQNNSIVTLRGATGAPQEMGTNVAVCEAVSVILKKEGYTVKVVDANYNDDPRVGVDDYDLFLAVHCDADYANDKGGGFCDYPDPSVDEANAKSKQLKEAIEKVFFPKVGIKITSHSNPNTKFYYMWQYLSPATPCVLIEMGQRQDPHDKPILENVSKVSEALALSIMKALPIEKPQDDLQCEELQKTINTLTKQLKDATELCGVLEEAKNNEREMAVKAQQEAQAYKGNYERAMDEINNLKKDNNDLTIKVASLKDRNYTVSEALKMAREAMKAGRW